MSEYLDRRTKALEEVAASLRRLRRVDEVEAWEAIRLTAIDNRSRSRGTADEDLWAIDVAICERRLAVLTGFRDVGADGGRDV